jgi:hypothetical protein
MREVVAVNTGGALGTTVRLALLPLRQRGTNKQGRLGSVDKVGLRGKPRQYYWSRTAVKEFGTHDS